MRWWLRLRAERESKREEEIQQVLLRSLNENGYINGGEINDRIEKAVLANADLVPSMTIPITDAKLAERAIAIVDATVDERLREVVERLVEETLELQPIRFEMADGKITMKLVGDRARARREV